MQSQSLWSVKQISIASFLAGPMAGCYFLGKNFREFGSPTYAKWCYLTGFLATLLFLAIPFFAPEQFLKYIPSKIIPIVYTSIITSYAHVYQNKIIKEKMDQGAQRRSFGWCFLLIFSFVVIQLSLLFVCPFIFEWLF